VSAPSGRRLQLLAGLLHLRRKGQAAEDRVGSIQAGLDHRPRVCGPRHGQEQRP
jgi:hypothetical protein